ncbi:hypothetical protein TNCV_2491761 [Trichonephila clavipes]|nr:hypothetical protein TNCV_2491761 [Trichonephila clavipes]
MSTLKNSMLELAAKFDDNYNTGLIKSFMFGLNKTEIKTMTDILSRYKFRDSHDDSLRRRAVGRLEAGQSQAEKIRWLQVARKWSLGYGINSKQGVLSIGRSAKITTEHLYPHRSVT